MTPMTLEILNLTSMNICALLVGLEVAAQCGRKRQHFQGSGVTGRQGPRHGSRQAAVPGVSSNITTTNRWYRAFRQVVGGRTPTTRRIGATQNIRRMLLTQIRALGHSEVSIAMGMSPHTTLTGTARLFPDQ